MSALAMGWQAAGGGLSVTPPALDGLIGCLRVGCRAVEDTIGPWARTPRRDRLADTPAGAF